MEWIKARLTRYLEFASSTYVIGACVILSGGLMLLMSGEYRPSVFGPRMSEEVAREKLIAIQDTEAVNDHLIGLLILDSIFPLVYFTLFCGLIYRCQPNKQQLLLALSPVVLLLWDYAEERSTIPFARQF